MHDAREICLDTLIVFSLLFSLAGCSEERRITTHSDQALVAYNIGVSQWQRFYYTEAKRAFDEAIRLDSAFAMAWVRRAALDDAMQNRDQARSDIDHAMIFLPRITPFEQMFIRLQSYRLSFSNVQAEGLADSMVRLYPGEKEVHLIRGNLYDLNKNFDESIRSYKRSISVDTSYALAVMSLGYAYSTIGEQEKAVAQMERYIRLAPDAADPRASFADILLRVGRYDEALDQYRQSLVLKPDYWYSVIQIGAIYMLKGRLKEAEEQFHKGMAALPASDQLKATHLALDGNLNLLRGQYREAVQEYEAALHLDPANDEAAYGLVNAFRKQKEFKRAHEMLVGIQKELERRNMATSQYMLRYSLIKAKLLLDEGEQERARALCDSALEFSTSISRGPVFQLIAEICVREQQYEEAFDACEEALRVNPNHPDALFTLAKAYYGTGDDAMTGEIRGRLLAFWKEADADFQMLRDLQQLQSRRRTPSPTSTTTVFIATAEN